MNNFTITKQEIDTEWEKIQSEYAPIPDQQDQDQGSPKLQHFEKVQEEAASTPEEQEKAKEFLVDCVAGAMRSSVFRNYSIDEPINAVAVAVVNVVLKYYPDPFVLIEKYKEEVMLVIAIFGLYKAVVEAKKEAQEQPAPPQPAAPQPAAPQAQPQGQKTETQEKPTETTQ